MNITKEKIISSVAKSEKEDITVVKNIYNAIEKKVFESLSNTTPDNNSDNPIVIKLFEGISLKGIYLPERKRKTIFSSNPDGMVTIKSGIDVKANITKRYKEKINGYKKEK